MVFVITGVSVPEVNIPRLPAVEDVLLVSQKRNKYYENKTVLLEKTRRVCLFYKGDAHLELFKEIHGTQRVRW